MSFVLLLNNNKKRFKKYIYNNNNNNNKLKAIFICMFFVLLLNNNTKKIKWKTKQSGRRRVCGGVWCYRAAGWPPPGCWRCSWCPPAAGRRLCSAAAGTPAPTPSACAGERAPCRRALRDRRVRRAAHDDIIIVLRLGAGGSPLMTSCRLISCGVRLSRTTRLTRLCQFRGFSPRGSSPSGGSSAWRSEPSGPCSSILSPEERAASLWLAPHDRLTLVFKLNSPEDNELCSRGADRASSGRTSPKLDHQT